MPKSLAPHENYSRIGYRRSWPPLVSRAMNLRHTSKHERMATGRCYQQRIPESSMRGRLAAAGEAAGHRSRESAKRGWCVVPGPYSTRLKCPIFLSSLSVRKLGPISCPLTAVVLLAAKFDNAQSKSLRWHGGGIAGGISPEAVSKRISA